MAKYLKLLDPVADFPSALRSFLHHLEARNLSSQTELYYRNKLKKWLGFTEAAGLTPHSVQANDVKGFLLALPEHLSPATRNSILRALKAFFNWLVREGWLESSPVAGIKPQKERRVILPTFSPEALEKLLSRPNKKTFCGLRDYTLMVMLADTGIRISEALGLQVRDIDLREGLLTVLGKGNKMRQVPIGQTAKRVLWKWLDARGDIPGQDLVFVNRSGNAWNLRRAERAIEHYGEKAKLQGVRVSPHTFRYTFATMWLKSGGDLFTLQRILGHTSLEMVRRYAQQVVTDLQEKHRIHSPMDKMMRK